MMDILDKIATARDMPLKVLVAYAIRLAKVRIRRYAIKFHPVKLSDKHFLKLVTQKNLDDLPPFFFNPDDKEEIIETIKRDHPESIEETIIDADEICAHTFDLLGSGKTELGEEIDWHLDFKSGYKWNPNEYYLGTGKYVTIDDDSDVKVPWELSRCQHFVTLGKAYWYNKQSKIDGDKYAREFVNQISDWIDANPVELGVNWACTMDVAIRAVNWIWGYYFFCDSPSVLKEFTIKLFKSLYLHGRHILNNLEFGEIRGNHYLSDVVGLVYLGILFRDTKEGKKWLEKCLSALKEEMEFQVLADGMHFEASISYHRLVTELFLSSVLLCEMNNLHIPAEVMAKLEKMIDFTMHYTKPDGTAPVIGDADDGRLYKLADTDINDHRYLLNIGAVLFNRSDFKAAYSEFNEESYWLLRTEGVEKFDEILQQNRNIVSKAYPNSGIYIMRKDDLYMIICGGHQERPIHTGHIHNDTFSFELYAGDKSFIIDPGTYVYTSCPSWRNTFRSTAYHNTVVMDGQEQNDFSDNNVFGIKSYDTLVKVNKWESNKEYDFFDAEHYGYHKLENPVTHRRQIYFNKQEKYWEITDILTGDGEHKFEWYFHFAPMKLEQDPKNPLIVRTKCEGTNIELVPTKVQEGLICEVLDGWVSYGYGIKEKAPVVRYEFKGVVPVEVQMRISIIKGDEYDK